MLTLHEYRTLEKYDVSEEGNLWHHEVPGVDVDATSAPDYHNSGKYWDFSVGKKRYVEEKRRGGGQNTFVKMGSPCLRFEHLNIMTKIDVGEVFNDDVKAPNVIHLTH